MAALQELEDLQQHALGRYFELMREANEQRPREIKAATNIQRSWRGYKTREFVNNLHTKAVRIQRAYRGHKGRKRYHAVKHARDVARQRAFFDAMAVIIQRHYRGYASRKKHHDFGKRKRYIDLVSGKADELRSDIKRQQAQQQLVEKLRSDADKAKRFQAVTENLHHLLSTSCQKGIYNSSFGEDFKATAFDIPVEDHIRDSFHNRLQRERNTLKEGKSHTASTKVSKSATSGAEGSANPAKSNTVSAKLGSSTARKSGLVRPEGVKAAKRAKPATTKRFGQTIS